MYCVKFFCPPSEGYELYLPLCLRDPAIKIKKVKIWVKFAPHINELGAIISDEDATYLLLKYPEIRGDKFYQL